VSRQEKRDQRKSTELKTTPRFDAVSPQENDMASGQYRIESRSPLMGSLLPPALFKQMYGDRSLAVAVAVKSVSDPSRQQVQVVHVPTGEIVFQTSPAPL
jgi:hypothetical protein